MLCPRLTLAAVKHEDLITLKHRRVIRYRCTCGLCAVYTCNANNTCTMGELVNHKRVLKHRPCSQGWAHRCPIRCVCTVRVWCVGPAFFSSSMTTLAT